MNAVKSLLLNLKLIRESEMENSTLDIFCGSKFWDDDLSWYTSDPDLTKCFEKTVLVWLPCFFLWILSPIEIYFILKSKNRDIPWNWRNLTKIALTSGLVVVALSDIVSAFTWASCNGSAVYSVDVYSPMLKTFTFAFSAVFVFYNRKYGMRTSGLLFLFWLFLLLCAIPQLRTEIRQSNKENRTDYSFTSFTIYFALVGCMTLLSAVADQPPKGTKHALSTNPCPEEGAGAPSRMLFIWFDVMAWKGYRKPLEIKDLWDLNPEDSAKELVPIFEKHWQASIKKSESYPSTQNGTGAKFSGKLGNVSFVHDIKSKKRVTVFPAIIKTFGLPFAFGSLLKAVADVLTFINPKILALLIVFVQQGQEPWKGFMYAGLIFAVNALQTFLNAYHAKVASTIGMKVRTVLISAVYKKSLRISPIARKDRTAGEIVNLMSVDTQRFAMMSFFIHLLWSAPLQICLSMYFLWQELGPSVLSGLALMVLLIPLNGYIANKVKSMQMKQMKSKDERVKLMNEILNGIKVLKLYAWEGSMEEMIQKVRQKEIVTLKQSAYLNASTSFIWTGAPFLVSLVTFATYACVNTHEVLDAQKAYVSISLFNIIRGPLGMLPMMISNYVQAYISTKRINDFLNAEELDPNNVTHEPNKEAPLIIENGTFSWGEEPILRDINIRCERNSLVAIVGSVGSGKSSLISALLGEMYKLSGKVNTDGSIAYASQQAWIQNATLKDNIIFGRPYNKTEYENVVDACALRADFNMLPAGDQTEIGEKGINLSGGQKQRISLARAVYSNADIYLLDDPLSAVDSHVGKHIFENVIGPKGLLKDKTRILVTHSITYLPQTDKVIVLKDGVVSESGTYLELLDRKGAFSEFLLQHLNEEIVDDEDLEEITDQLESTPLGEEVRRISRSRPRVSESISESGSERIINGSYQRQMSIASQNSIRSLKKMTKSTELLKQDTTKVKEGKLIEAEKAETGSVKWEVYKHYISSIGVWLMLFVVLLNITYQAFSVGSNVWVGVWADDNDTLINGTVNTAKRDMYLAIYGVLGIGQALATMLSNLLFAKGTIDAAVKIHRQLLHNVMRLPCAFFDITPVGRILGRFSQDINGVDMRLPNAFQMLMSTLVRVISTIFVISYTSPLFIAVVVPVGIVYIGIQRIYVASSRQLMRLTSVTASPIYSHFGETLSGAQTIRSYKKQDDFIEDSERKVDVNQSCQYPTIISSRWLAVRLETIGNLIIFFAALFAVIERDGEPALVGLSVSYALQITQTLNWLVRMTSEAETTIVAMERVKEYVEIEKEAQWDMPGKILPADWPQNGVVDFKKYSVRYRPGLELVLKDLTVHIEGGEKVGIVGRTGAGKSSLTLALFRIIEPTEGHIFIDGVDISELGLHTLRSRLTIIPQDPVLLSGSLRMNLDPFQNHTDEELWDALENCHLKQFVQNQQAGLHFEVTEGGDNLSVGQRQLICLGRALLRRTKVLILDEATAAVDLETDDLIQRTIRIAFNNCTILTIAHRLNTIMDSDKILVLDKGRIVEYDTPQSLLEDQNTIFYGMCKDAGLV